ncbi:MAG: hypothetical protein AAF629_05335 [Chloroflexota bacterium]
MSALRLVIFYLLWLISCALGLIDLYYLFPAFDALIVSLGATAWNTPALNRGFIFVVGVIGVIFILLCEVWYKKASEVGYRQLLQLFGLVTVVQVIIFAIAYYLPRYLVTFTFSG